MQATIRRRHPAKRRAAADHDELAGPAKRARFAPAAHPSTASPCASVHRSTAPPCTSAALAPTPVAAWRTGELARLRAETLQLQLKLDMAQCSELAAPLVEVAAVGPAGDPRSATSSHGSGTAAPSSGVAAAAPPEAGKCDPAPRAAVSERDPATREAADWPGWPAEAPRRGDAVEAVRAAADDRQTRERARWEYIACRSLCFVELDAFARRWSPTAEDEAYGVPPGKRWPFQVVLSIRRPVRYLEGHGYDQHPVMQRWHEAVRATAHISRYLGLAPVLSPEMVPVEADPLVDREEDHSVPYYVPPRVPCYDTRDLEVQLDAPAVCVGLPAWPGAAATSVGAGMLVRSSLTLDVLRLALERAVPPPFEDFHTCHTRENRCIRVAHDIGHPIDLDAWRAAAYGHPPLAWVWRERSSVGFGAQLTGLSVALDLDATRRLHLFGLARARGVGEHRGRAPSWCPLAPVLLAVVLDYLP